MKMEHSNMTDERTDVSSDEYPTTVIFIFDNNVIQRL